MQAAIGASRRRAGLPFDLNRDWDRLAWPVFGAILLVAFVDLNLKGRGANFFYDDWGWIQQRYSGLHWILASYNQHLLAVPIALYQVLFKTIGLTQYWVFRLLQVSVHLATAAAVFAFARRRLGVLAVLLVLPIVFLGSAWEYILEPINFGFVASIGLSVGALLLLDRETARRNGLACAMLVRRRSVLGVRDRIRAGRRRRTHPARPQLSTSLGVARAVLRVRRLVALYHESTSFRRNLTSVPSYAADLAASATGGLFGLKIDWGRPLLLAAIAGLIIVCRRPGALTPRLAGLLVAAGAYWGLVALGRAQLGMPTADRYIYAGAVLLVLIAVGRDTHRTRGVRCGGARRALAVAANIRILSASQGGLVIAARTVSAELAAVEVARGNLPPQLIVDTHFAPALFVGPYFRAIDALHSSPADSPTQLLHESEDARVAADTVLIRGREITAEPPASNTIGTTPPSLQLAAGGTVTTRGACLTLRSAGSGAAFDLTLPASGVLVKATRGPLVEIRARRFAAGYKGAPISALPGGRLTLIRAEPDHSALPWHLRISPRQTVVACSAR